jgi:hypothetical protein
MWALAMKGKDRKVNRRRIAALPIASAAMIPPGARSASAVAKEAGVRRGYELRSVSDVLSTAAPGFEDAIVTGTESA